MSRSRTIALTVALAVGLAAPLAATPATAAPVSIKVAAPSRSATERAIQNVREYTAQMTLAGYPVTVNAEKKRIEAQVESITTYMRKMVIGKDITLDAARTAVTTATASTQSLITWLAEYKKAGAKFSQGRRSDTIVAKIKNKTVSTFAYGTFLSDIAAKRVILSKYAGKH